MIRLIDFNDSFTYNIGAIISQMGLDVEVIPYEQIDSIRVQDSREVVMLGPGPGHPSEYPKAIAFIKKYLGNKNIFFMGICLGHQLIFHAKGSQVEQSLNPMHGQSEIIAIPKWFGIFQEKYFFKKMEVQRYNSLCVKDYAFSAEVVKNKSNEIVMARGEGFFSCQFHPESIGTSCPESFFYSIVNYLYNVKDGSKNEARRPLR